jgi:DNA-binding GntR family transcriptional regulator
MRISAYAVCTAIRDAIVDGSFPPGTRLTEELLARRHGVSRVPVREALRILESEGFVVTRRHAGAFVAEPGEHEAADLLDVRTLLEPLGAARAARRRTQAHLKVLRGLVRLAQQRIAHGQLGDLRSLDDWFHETLAHASGSPSLAALLIQLRRKLAWLCSLQRDSPDPCDSRDSRDPCDPRWPQDTARRAAAVWQEHAALTEAITRGDAERARTLAAARLGKPAAPRIPSQSSADTLPGKTHVRRRKHPVNTMRERM